MLIRKALPLLGLLALLLTLFTTGGTTLATTSSSNVDIAALQKSCAVIGIHLDGAQHTITCIHKALPHSSQPMLARDVCGSGYINIQVINNDYGAHVCFSGRGYLGVNLYQVNEVDNESQSGGAGPMWMRWYRSSGVICTIQAYRNKIFGGGITNVEVTQLDFGDSNGPNC